VGLERCECSKTEIELLPDAQIYRTREQMSSTSFDDIFDSLICFYNGSALSLEGAEGRIRYHQDLLNLGHEEICLMRQDTSSSPRQV